MAEPNQDAINTAVGLISARGLQTIALNSLDINSISSSINVNQTMPSPTEAKLSSTDFAYRYMSLDSTQSSEDGSDIAYLRVLKFVNGMFGKQVFPINSNGSLSNYQDFIVTNTSSGMIEKAQLIKTNKTLQIYAFDSQVEVLNIQGVLKSTIENNWDMAMVLLWDDLLRLTKLIQLGLIVEFGYQSNVYWGYPLNFQYQKSSNMQYLVSYSMQFVILKRSALLKNSIQSKMMNDLARQINTAINS
jgi:hypothetical protein